MTEQPWPYNAYEGDYGPQQVSHRAKVDARGLHVTACGRHFNPDGAGSVWGVGGPTVGFVPTCDQCRAALFQPISSSLRRDALLIPWRADGDRVVTFATDGQAEGLVANFPFPELARHIAEMHNESLETYR